ncbi:hypothetical protein V8C42DRAFT_57534 [Trichoderma barbatum]
MDRWARDARWTGSHMNRPHVKRAAALWRAACGEDGKFVESRTSRKDTSHKVNRRKGIIIAGRKERHAKHGRAACPGVEILRGNLTPGKHSTSGRCWHAATGRPQAWHKYLYGVEGWQHVPHLQCEAVTISARRQTGTRSLGSACTATWLRKQLFLPRHQLLSNPASMLRQKCKPPAPNKLSEHNGEQCPLARSGTSTIAAPHSLSAEPLRATSDPLEMRSCLGGFGGFGFQRASQLTPPQGSPKRTDV